MSVLTITKAKLIELGFRPEAIKRFSKQTNNTEDPVEILSLIGGKNKVNELFLLSSYTVKKEKMVALAISCAESVQHLESELKYEEITQKGLQAAKNWLADQTEDNYEKADVFSRDLGSLRSYAGINNILKVCYCHCACAAASSPNTYVAAAFVLDDLDCCGFRLIDIDKLFIDLFTIDD